LVTAYEKKKLALYKRYFKAKSAHTEAIRKWLKNNKFAAQEKRARIKMEKSLSALKIQLRKKRRK